MVNPTEETLRVQLSELNNRSRWYCSQMWQIPFAFIGIAGLSIGTLISTSNRNIGIACIALTVVGILIGIHLYAIMKLKNLSISKLYNVETSLGIEPEERAVNTKLDVITIMTLEIGTTLFLLCLGISFLRTL